MLKGNGWNAAPFRERFALPGRARFFHSQSQKRKGTKKKSPSPLMISCFGAFRLRYQKEFLTPRSGKARELLALLACEGGGPVTKRRAASLLWEEAGPEQAMDSLSKVCRSLMDFSRQHKNCIPLKITRRELALEPGGFWCDLTEFLELTAKGDRESLRRAAALYTGELFAADCFEWSEGPAARYEVSFMELCQELAERYRREGKEKLAKGYEKLLE